jgi:hypothetical protein
MSLFLADFVTEVCCRFFWSVIPLLRCDSRRERAMMGRLNHEQEQFFYSFRLDEAVPEDHPVREIAAVVDLSWVHSELAAYYPKLGRIENGRWMTSKQSEEHLWMGRRDLRRINAGSFILPERGRSTVFIPPRSLDFGVARQSGRLAGWGGAGEKNIREPVRAVRCGPDRTRMV